MPRELCYCGLNTVETEHATHCVNGEVCCTKACYNQAIMTAIPVPEFHTGRVKPVEVGGYQFGIIHDKRQPRLW